MVVYKKENCNRGKKDNHVGRYHVTLVELEGVIRAKAMLLVPGSSLNGEKQCQGLGSIAMESDFLFRVRTAQGSQSSTFQDHQTHTLRRMGEGSCMNVLLQHLLYYRMRAIVLASSVFELAFIRWPRALNALLHAKVGGCEETSSHFRTEADVQHSPSPNEGELKDGGGNR